MKRMLVALVAISLLPAGLAAQTIRAKDGDVILVENNDKVKIVRRRQANVRVVYNDAQRWVAVLADWLSVPGGGDNRVDWVYTFREITGFWPLGERWEGVVFIDQHEYVGGPSGRAVSMATPSGLVQFLPAGPSKEFADPTAVATIEHRSGGGSSDSSTFDIAEQRAVARIAQEAAGGPVSVGSGSFRTTMGMSAGLIGSSPDAIGPQPVRVGGNIRAPVKIKHVDGVLPGAARQAGVFGMVILEIMIGTDGTVQSAKVLRSIPMLDQAAIDAVKQWVFEPTHLNGTPVPVIMTATVNFTQ